MHKRGSGILLHITSLPSPYGIGDLGPHAYAFVDVLAEAKQKFWQVLPLTPTDPISGNSPYSSNSAFAGNTLLISPDILQKQGLLSTVNNFVCAPHASAEWCDYEYVVPCKQRMLTEAYDNFKTRAGETTGFDTFCREQAAWLDDYALFVAIKRQWHEGVWSDWPDGLGVRDTASLKTAQAKLADEIEKEKFWQFLFFEQWQALKTYCSERAIQLIGDIPIYVNYDSADVWAHPELFKLDKHKKPKVVAGVPPDYFSKTGQRWGNPVYAWDVLRKEEYAWWLARIAHTQELFDIVRIDHFRGLVACWEIKADEPTAVNGKWVKAPVDDFITTLLKRFPALPIIAEDLGVITADVRKVLKKFNIPGMKILQFAFNEDNKKHPYLPHLYPENCLAYSGTHDNNTMRGWFEHEASESAKKRLSTYFGKDISTNDLHWECIQSLMHSKAAMVILPLQDVLGLGEEARMNRPAIGEGNWRWRLMPDQITADIKNRLRAITEESGRG